MRYNRGGLGAYSRRRAGLADRSAGVVLLGLAAAWAAYAASAAVATLVALPGDGAAQLVYAGESPTEEGWLRLLDSREAALRHHERGSFRRDLGTAYFVLAETFADVATMRADLLGRASQQLQAALARSPADPPALALLVETLLEQDQREAARRWLDAARALAPYSPETASSRVNSDLRLGRPVVEVAQLRDLRSAFEQDRPGVARLLIAFGVDNELLGRASDAEFRYELSVALMRAREELATQE